MTLRKSRRKAQERRTGGRQKVVSEGSWSRLLEGFQLLAGWENMQKHEKGKRVRKGRSVCPGSYLWDLRDLHLRATSSDAFHH